MKTSWRHGRERLRRLLLRGPILGWWVGRRARQWERAYCGELVRDSGGPAAPAPGPSFTASAVLRTILFISDCMWEQNDLVPELRKIADVTVLDLGPKLKARPDSQPARECVAVADKFEFFPYGVFSGGGDNYQRWAKRFDVNLTNCLPATEWYHQRGLPCLYVPHGVRQPEYLD